MLSQTSSVDREGVHVRRSCNLAFSPHKEVNKYSVKEGGGVWGDALSPRGETDYFQGVVRVDVRLSSKQPGDGM